MGCYVAYSLQLIHNYDLNTMVNGPFGSVQVKQYLYESCLTGHTTGAQFCLDNESRFLITVLSLSHLYYLLGSVLINLFSVNSVTSICYFICSIYSCSILYVFCFTIVFVLAYPYLFQVERLVSTLLCFP